MQGGAPEGHGSLNFLSFRSANEVESMLILIGIGLSITAVLAGSCAGYGLAAQDRNKISIALASGTFFTLITIGLYYLAKHLGTDLIWLWIIMLIIGSAIGFKGRDF
jgi:predicted permease